VSFNPSNQLILNQVFTRRPMRTLETEGNIDLIYDAIEIPLPFRRYSVWENHLRNQKRVEAIFDDLRSEGLLNNPQELRDGLNPAWEGKEDEWFPTPDEKYWGDDDRSDDELGWFERQKRRKARMVREVIEEEEERREEATPNASSL
jgi:hypothetical protein